MIKVIIIEDLSDYLETLCSIIVNTNDLECAGTYETAEAALKDVRNASPDVALVDINLPGMSGIKLVQEIRKASPKTLCMMFTAYDEDEKVFKSLEAGAHGYLLKSTTPKEIIAAIHELVKGGAPMSSQVARKVVEAFKKDPPQKDNFLTQKETEVLELLAKGMLYKEIGAKLNISIQTVRCHCFNIYKKLHVNNRTEALNKYYRM